MAGARHREPELLCQRLPQPLVLVRRDFQGPTVYARVGRATGDRRYYDYLDREFRVTCDTLYCPEERLFFRDTRYIGMRERNGERVFWGPG